MKIMCLQNVKRLFGSLLVITAVLVWSSVQSLAGDSSMVRLSGHIPTKAVANASFLGGLPGNTPISLAFVLPLRNQAELTDLLKRVYDPADPLYGHYLTPREFADRFGPTQDDYDAVADYARGLGFTVTGKHPNRTLLDVSGTAAQAEAAFNLHLNNYQAPSGRIFHAPDQGPQLPDAIASRIAGVIGLDSSAVWHPHNRAQAVADPAQVLPFQVGTGPGGGLTPGDIRAAYNLNGVTATGGGQTLGLFELAGYKASDVTAYESYFGLPAVPLQNVLVDGSSGHAGLGSDEVTLDIDLQIGLAPGASKIIVYEGPNTITGVADTYNRIATDNLAKQISTSWGLSEGNSTAALLDSENASFQQMAAQGQSIYAASGDSGAYDDGSNLSVDDPASQPYMVGVGGTQLFVGSGEKYDHETTWNVNGTVSGGAGGGGVSAVWQIPSWQQGVGNTTAASDSMRNVPDVSLNSDQYTGYSIYYHGGWWIYGGTSCASPLWAAFTARVNQQRQANGTTSLGFANPAIYSIGSGSNYGIDFHDIDDESTNLYYEAVKGYDNATGWGTFNGANLFAELTGSSSATSAPLAPTGLTATAGDVAVALTWNASDGATTYNIYRSTTSGGEGSTPIKTGITSTSYTDNSVTNGITYYYEVSATNSAGTSQVSNEASATPVTSSSPSLAIISGPSANADRTSAQIQWDTNIPADSVVNYGLSAGNYAGKVSNNSSVTAHSLDLSGLTRHTFYYYEVSSSANGETVTATGRFRTH